MGAKMFDKTLIEEAGLPVDSKYATHSRSKQASCRILQSLRIMDQQDAINSFKWYGLTETLRQQLERILYYRGSAALFKYQGKFYVLPYTLGPTGSIDIYGRYSTITPVPFNGQMSTNDDGDIKPWIKGLEFIPRYDVVLEEEFIDEEGNFDVEKANEFLEKSCVIINDRSNQFSQTILARANLNEPILQYEEACVPYAMTALSNSTGIMGIRVDGQDAANQVEMANASAEAASRSQRKYIALTAQMDMQPLTNGSTANSEEFLLTMQALDNLRLSTHGLSNGGLFQKKAHMLGEEQQMNENKSSRVIQDRLKQRQMSCNIINSLWSDFDSDNFVWCDVSDPVLGYDYDNDGTLYNTEMPQEEQVAENNEEEVVEE